MVKGCRAMDKNITLEIFNKLMSKLPKYWLGEQSIKFMKYNGCNHWRQMEWAGFYFQFMCEMILAENNFFEIPGKKYGNVEFDGFKVINYDFKAHSEFPGSTSKVPTNGYVEVTQAISEYGTVGFIVANGTVVFDSHLQTFKHWHDEFKGNTSEYEIERIKRGAPSRRRKVSFDLHEIVFLFVDEITLELTGKFQGGMRNSNGTPRNHKVMIDLNDPRFEKHIYKVVK